MPSRLRRVLHRALDLIADPRYAGGQTGRRALRPADRRQPMYAVRSPRAPAGVRQPAAIGRDVRADECSGADLPDAAGGCDCAAGTVIESYIMSRRYLRYEWTLPSVLSCFAAAQHDKRLIAR